MPARQLKRQYRMVRRGGGDAYDGPIASGPPQTTYAAHTTINGSRTSFIVVIVIAFLVFVALLAGGWWLYSRRRQRRRVASSSAAKRISAMFNSTTTDRSTRHAQDPSEDDAFDLSPSNNVSMMDLNYNSRNQSRADGLEDYSNRLNPGLGYSNVYAASGESLAWQPPHHDEEATPTPDKSRFDSNRGDEKGL